MTATDTSQYSEIADPSFQEAIASEAARTIARGEEILGVVKAVARVIDERIHDVIRKGQD